MTQRFVKGLSLDEKVKRDGPLEPGQAVGICQDVAEGLEALWAAGMVHRDVKPANILLDEDGTAYITDFGLAKDIQGSLLTLPGQAHHPARPPRLGRLPRVPCRSGPRWADDSYAARPRAARAPSQASGTFRRSSAARRARQGRRRARAPRWLERCAKAP